MHPKVTKGYLRSKNIPIIQGTVQSSPMALDVLQVHVDGRVGEEDAHILYCGSGRRRTRQMEYCAT